MKRAMVAFAVVGLLASPASVSVASAYGRAAVSIGVFYDSLSPYGEWVSVGTYGRAWRPSVEIVGVGFRPYVTGGHWVYTDYGWSFESGWDWGWAPFHYGRWLLDPYYGWVWVPDTVWGPAWVTWRFGGGYAGWAPLPPIGAAIVVERHRPSWCFVETRHFVAHDFHRHTIPERRYHEAFGVTAPVVTTSTYHGIRYYAGPPPGQVSTEAGRPVEAVRVSPPPPGIVARHQLGPERPPGGASGERLERLAPAAEERRLETARPPKAFVPPAPGSRRLEGERQRLGAEERQVQPARPPSSFAPPASDQRRLEQPRPPRSFAPPTPGNINRQRPAPEQRRFEQPRPAPQVRRQPERATPPQQIRRPAPDSQPPPAVRQAPQAPQQPQVAPAKPKRAPVPASPAPPPPRGARPRGR